MKKTLLLLSVLLLLTSCSHVRKILVKNCVAVGSGLYQCEELNQKDIQPRR